MADNGFRSAGRGYNKDDVNARIIELDRKVKAAQDDASEARVALENYKRSSSDAKLPAENSSKLVAQIDEQKKRIAELEAKLAKSSEAAKDASDEISRRLGSVLLVAQNSADALIASAKSEATRISEAASERAVEIRVKAESEAKVASDTAKKELADRNARIDDAFGALIADFKKNFENETKRLTDMLAASLTASKAKIEKIASNDSTEKKPSPVAPSAAKK